MVSLLDIGPMRRIVQVRGIAIIVRPISGMALFSLLDSFPELRKLFSDGAAPADPNTLLVQAPAAIAAAVAYATSEEPNSPPKEEVMAAFLDLALGEQLEIVKAIWEITFPQGTQYFLDALEMFVPDIKSGWGRGTPSPGPSSNLSPQDTPKTESGSTPQG